MDKKYTIKNFITTIGLIGVLVSLVKMVIDSFVIFSKLCIFAGIGLLMIMTWVFLVYQENRNGEEDVKYSIGSTIVGAIGLISIIASVILVLYNFVVTDLLFTLIGVFGVILAAVGTA